MNEWREWLKLQADMAYLRRLLILCEAKQRKTMQKIMAAAKMKDVASSAAAVAMGTLAIEATRHTDLLGYITVSA